jgi:hypothetical protein
MPLFDDKIQSNLITPMLLRSSTTKSQSSGDKLSITSSAFTHIMDNSSYGSNNHTTIVPTDMMESEGEDNEMAETEDLERLETCATEESQEHTCGTKPDKDDQDGQDNKKQRIAESFSTLITGDKRKIRAVRNQKKSRLFLSERSKLYEFSQSNRILLVIPSSQSDNEESSIVHSLNPSIEAADGESLRVYDYIVRDYPDLIIKTGRTETSISYQLHELVPFAIGLCREMLVRDNGTKEKLGVRSKVLRDGSLNKVFANCIHIVTSEYINNIAQFFIVESFPFKKIICYHALGTLKINYSTM